MSEVILHAEKIDKSFVGTHAIDHVTLDFYKGEIHALIGENVESPRMAIIILRVYPAPSRVSKVAS